MANHKMGGRKPDPNKIEAIITHYVLNGKKVCPQGGLYNLLTTEKLKEVTCKHCLRLWPYKIYKTI